MKEGGEAAEQWSKEKEQLEMRLAKAESREQQLLAEGLGLLPAGARLSAQELLQHLTQDPIRARHS